MSSDARSFSGGSVLVVETDLACAGFVVIPKNNAGPNRLPWRLVLRGWVALRFCMQALLGECSSEKLA